MTADRSAHTLPLDQLIDDVEEVNRDNGWHDAERSPAASRVLLHSEVAEAFEAYRSHGFADVTVTHLQIEVPSFAGRPAVHVDGAPLENPKPEGIGSELADVVIRMLDTLLRGSFWLPDYCKGPLPQVAGDDYAGDDIVDVLDRLHDLIAREDYDRVIPTVAWAAHLSGVVLADEVDRKLAHNRTRGHMHGGKRL